MAIARTRVAVSAAALAATALSAGAATASAVPSPDYASNGVITVRYYDAPLGLTVSIWDDDNPDGAAEVCRYASIGANGTLPFTGTSVLNGHGPGSMYIPGQSLSQRFMVTINCDGTGGSLNFSVRY